jgi:acyl-[acyl-carrier-protein] desaturase
VTPTPGRDATTQLAPPADPVVPPLDMLKALEPALARGLELHRAKATEWFPHDYVPYEVGRNYVEEPWEEKDSDLSPIARVSLEVNLLTEDNLPYYHLAIWKAFDDDGLWGAWVRRWTAEEGRHSILLRDYLTVTRGVDPERLEQGRMDMVLRGWYPNFAETGPLDGVIFTTIQELATRLSHRNTGEITEDESARRVCARVATDENLHYVFYRDLATHAIAVDPSAALLAIKRQLIGFAMPGADMPGFRDKAKAMARAGIYNVRIHVEQVLRPVLENHWKIGELDGLSDEAKQAREDIYAHLARLDRIATKLGEPLGPVTGDLSDDPIDAP